MKPQVHQALEEVLVTQSGVQELNRKLKAFLRSDLTYRKYLPTETWLTGGCWLLAEALRRVLGGNLITVASRRGIEHVALEVDGWLIDGDGVSRPETLLRHWRTREGIRDAQFAPFNAVQVRAQGIPPPDARLPRLVADLRQVLA